MEGREGGNDVGFGGEGGVLVMGGLLGVLYLEL